MKEVETIVDELTSMQEEFFYEICDCKIKQYLQTLEISNENSISEEYKKNYNNFYGMNRTSPNFKAEYFSLMKGKEEKAETYEEKFKRIAGNLNGKDKNYQFSFITKLLHTLNQDFPIYDRFIRETLELEEVYSEKSYEEKVSKSLVIMQEVIDLYSKLEKNEGVNKIFDNFDSRFLLAKDFTNTKKLDYMLWVLGKIQFEAAEEEKQNRSKK